MTSATWPEDVRRLALGYMKTPVTVFIGSLDLAAVHSVTQRIIRCSNEKKDEELFSFLTNLAEDEKVKYIKLLHFYLIKSFRSSSSSTGRPRPPRSLPSAP